MSSCNGCKFWSDKVAKIDESTGQLKALCLNKDSAYRSDYVYKGCWKFDEGDSVDLEMIEEQVS